MIDCKIWCFWPEVLGNARERTKAQQRPETQIEKESAVLDSGGEVKYVELIDR